ncbi:MAG: GntR family transcriptional regulator [Opitutales bacterium]
MSAVKTLREQIADQLRNEILSKQHAPESRLREVQLAARFGTSRGPVRDVFLQLAQEGVLVYRPNAGVTVSPATDDGTRALLMGLRKQIEFHALPRFLKNLTEEQASAMRDILDEMEGACRRKNMPDIVGSDIALHRYVVRHGATAEVEKVWLNIAVRILMNYSRLPDYVDIHKEHVRMVDAICSKNLKASRAALEANLI